MRDFEIMGLPKSEITKSLNHQIRNNKTWQKNL
jgi:hypothetical protein